MSCGDNWTAWCIAEDGEVVRHYDADEDGDDEPAHPAESGYLLPHQDGFPEGAFDGVSPTDSEAITARYRQVKEDLQIPDTYLLADNIAARLSVDSAALGANTRTSGCGVLALIACGREHGPPRRGAARVTLPSTRTGIIRVGTAREAISDSLGSDLHSALLGPGQPYS
jgi:hypothetical protein